jgi:hypothetical protein
VFKCQGAVKRCLGCSIYGKITKTTLESINAFHENDRRLFWSNWRYRRCGLLWLWRVFC